MQTNFTWSNDLFSSLYQISSNGIQVGMVKDKAFSSISETEIHGKRYQFRTTGILNRKTEIIDLSESRIIGEITYGKWMKNAMVNVSGKSIEWKPNNWWSTNWSMNENSRILIDNKGSMRKGHISAFTDDGLIILIGMVIANYFRQTSIAVLVAAMTPIWVSIMNLH